MSDEVLTPDNNLVLRNLQGLRRDMHEMIELTDELALRVSELTTRMDEDFNDGQSDIMRVVRRLDEGGTDHRLALDP